MVINREITFEIKKDFPPEFIKGDIITVDTQAKVKVGDWVVKFPDTSIKQVKKESGLGKEFFKIIRRLRLLED